MANLFFGKTIEASEINWGSEVTTIRSFLDETYIVSLRGNASSNTGSDKQLAWARIGVEKFCDRIIPQVRNTGKQTSRALNIIVEALKDAVSFGNSTLIVNSDGSYRVTTPENCVAKRDPFGTVSFKESLGEDVTNFGINGKVYVQKTKDGEIYDTGSTFYSIFYHADGRHCSGRSRISPAIRNGISAASRNKIRTEEGADFTVFPQKVLNGVWDTMHESVHNSIKKLAAGMTKMIALPKGPDGEIIKLEEFSAAPLDPYVKLHDSYARDVASAFNISPEEFGVNTTNPSSADALYAAKEDIIKEIEAFERIVQGTLENFLYKIAEINGETEPILYWLDPAAPSKASMADAFVKMAAVLPELSYSNAALAWAGLPGTLADEIIAEREKSFTRVQGVETE